MKSNLHRIGTRLLAATAMIVLPVLGTVVPANAANTVVSHASQTVTYNLQSSAIGQTANSTLSVSVSASAPATVAPGGALTVTLATGPITVPTSASGYTINQIQNIALSIPVPANSSYKSCALSGGSGLGSTPSCGTSGGNVVVTVPGPIAGGATFTLPTLTINLTAANSGTITTKLGGTSYSNPGLTFTAVITVIFFNVNAATVGYPTTSPVLTSTTIS